MIRSQHDAVHEQRHDRKQRGERCPRQELLDAAVVADALHDVARVAAVEKRNGQPQQFGKEIGEDAQIEPDADVHQNPRPDEVDRNLTHEQQQLRHQNELDKVQVAGLDAHVHHGLREEGHG